MLTSFACSCVRNGRKVSTPATRLSLRTLALTGTQDFSRPLSSRPLRPDAATPRQPPRGLASRSVSLSASSRAESQSRDSHDWDTFGSLSADLSSRRSFKKASPYFRDLDGDPEGEESKEEPLQAPRRLRRTNTPYWYFLQCKKLIRENKLQEALDLFSRDMLQGERLQPEEFNYTVLIGGCGRAGQLQKAFKLYNDLKKRGLEASDATYTALFNACAESPSKPAGLQQALKLEQELRRKNYPLSTITYHALLKAHAITNHLQACLHTLREMLQNGHVVTQETFHYLLMGCLKEKETGFRLALQVWRQMLHSGIIPDSQNYDLLLRTARDCGIGDPALASSILLTTDRQSRRRRREVSASKAPLDIDLLEKQLFFQPGPHSESQQDTGQHSTDLMPVSKTGSTPPSVYVPGATAPSLLDVFEGKSGAVVSLGTVADASNRLALIGGAEGLLEKMTTDGVSPGLRTLTLLADMAEPGRQSLQGLLKVAKQHRVKLDVGFFNSAIRRAAKASDHEAAKAVLSVMRERNVSVDVRTFGCLALSCDQQKDGLQLLDDMKEAGLRPNAHVFSALIGRAARRLDYAYLKTILQTMRNMDVWPNEVIIKQLEFAAQYPPDYNKSRNNYLVHIDGFRGYYQQWLRQMPAQSTDGETEEPQPQSDAAPMKTEAVDGLTEAQRNQRAAARRFYSRNPDKKRNAASTL
uniref:Pentatricopeptide repeat domain 1 n=1 Tax=Salarias fasciatus TaxID=181472 RepID=A0A672IFK1_SALFA